MEPVIHLKAYSGVQVYGIDQPEVRCDINSSQLATLVEEDGQVYVTINASCTVEVPSNSSLVIEKGMGSVKIKNIHNKIDIEKVLGNLVLNDIEKAKNPWNPNIFGPRISVRRLPQLLTERSSLTVCLKAATFLPITWFL